MYLDSFNPEIRKIEHLPILEYTDHYPYRTSLHHLVEYNTGDSIIPQKLYLPHQNVRNRIGILYF